MKYPIGIQTFEQIREDGYVYVDKTDLIYSLANEGKIYFLSRPRRFGKSLLISTLENYFLGRKELFKGLAIEKLEKEWKEYPVFHIDFNGGTFTNSNELTIHINYFLSSWEKQYGCTEQQALSFGLRFKNIIAKARQVTGKRVVVLIDEYDKPILDVLDQDITIDFQGNKVSLEDRNRDILKGFYSTFKLADKDLQFVLLTGVTKFSQVSVFSGFNQPQDISMSVKYDTLCGITQEELQNYFPQAIQQLTQEYECDTEEAMRRLKAHYDGYHFSKRLKDVYNPFSLLNAFQNSDLQDYWFKTGTPTYLVRLLGHFKENLNELTGKYYASKEFDDYKADVERPLPMIYQSGYLTIKDYDRDMNTFMLDFPNDEVKEGFVTLVANNYFGVREYTDSWVRSAVISLRKGELDTFREQLTSFLASIPYSMRRKESEREKERYFHYTFYLLLRLMSVYTVYTEKQQSHGRVDCIVETKDYVYIFEFKLDGTAEEALRQIEDKGYAKPYITDKRPVYKIGVSFSSETGTVNAWETADC